MKRLTALLTVLLASCVFLRRVPPVIELPIVSFDPPFQYQFWAQAAIDCARVLKEKAPELPFTVVHDSVDVRQFVWAAVATESGDGAFPCAQAGRCAGRFDPPDTVLISSQLLTRSWVVKHEILHWAVESATETQLKHDLPWGMCEFQISG